MHANLHLRRLRAATLLLLALLTTHCSTTPSSTQSAPPQVVHALAPTGTLRIAVYAGSPTSLVRDPGKSEPRGVAVDLGRTLARALGVPPDVVEFGNNADALAAIRAGNADFAFTNATPARAHEMDFSQPLFVVEQGYLVRAGASVDVATAVDRTGVKIGVSRGSTSERELAGLIRAATVVPVGSLKDAAARLTDGSLDAFATNKAILHELADRVPGARIVPGAYGREAFAMAIPKSHAAGLPWLREFAAKALAQGDVARAVERAGLRGTQPADAPSR